MPLSQLPLATCSCWRLGGRLPLGWWGHGGSLTLSLWRTLTDRAPTRGGPRTADLQSLAVGHRVTPTTIKPLEQLHVSLLSRSRGPRREGLTNPLTTGGLLGSPISSLPNPGLSALMPLAVWPVPHSLNFSGMTEITMLPKP